MPLEIVGSQYFGQIGMTLEMNTEEIVNLALEPVGGIPDGCGGRQLLPFLKAYFEAHAAVILEGKQKINDLVALLALGPVRGRQIGQEIIGKVFILIQSLENIEDIILADNKSKIIFSIIFPPNFSSINFSASLL
jgi:hypothetical protein